MSWKRLAVYFGLHAIKPYLIESINVSRLLVGYTLISVPLNLN